MRRRTLELLLIGTLLAAAAGCGQKGPLYLPGQGPDSDQSEQGDE